MERGEQKEAILTEAGIERAEKVVRKHRIIERFLTDFMGYTPEESHVQADELGDTFTDDMIERINERLGNPDRCPHGWPVDTAVEHAENQELVSLSGLKQGQRATVVRLAEHDGELLHWFYSEGLVPGSTVDVRSVHDPRGNGGHGGRRGARRRRSCRRGPLRAPALATRRDIRHLCARADQAVRQHRRALGARRGDRPRHHGLARLERRREDDVPLARARAPHARRRRAHGARPRPCGGRASRRASASATRPSTTICRPSWLQPTSYATSARCISCRPARRCSARTTRCGSSGWARSASGRSRRCPRASDSG